MSDAPLMIGVSGLRGIVGKSLTPEVAVKFAGVFGTWLWERSPGAEIVVGRDGRAGGEGIYNLVIGSLLSTGCRVIPVDVAMTPTVGVAVDEHGASAGVVITASHNPGEWNGIKLLLRAIENEPENDEVDGAWARWYALSKACAPSKAAAEDIIDHYNSYSVPWERPYQPESSTQFLSEHDVVETHAKMVWGSIVINDHENIGSQLDRPLDRISGGGKKSKKWRVVLDSVNSSGAAGAEKLIGMFHAEAIQLHGDDSGIFPHTPEPTAENLSGEGGLCDAVPGLKADVGFAQDPDGDRLAIVDETGAYIGEEYTFVLCAVSVLEAMKAKSELGEDVVLCANLSTSRMIDDVAASYGATVVRTAVGEANVVEAMKRLKAEGKNVVLGGEGNGGVIWPKVTYVRDSLGSMALVLSLMARTGKTVSELVAGVPSYAIVKRKQSLAKKEDAQPTIEKLAEHYKDQRVDRQDGVRIDFDEAKAWVHVRASNTEPILRLIGEVPTAEAAEKLLDEVQGLVDAG